MNAQQVGQLKHKFAVEIIDSFEAPGAVLPGRCGHIPALERMPLVTLKLIHCRLAARVTMVSTPASDNPASLDPSICRPGDNRCR